MWKQRISCVWCTFSGFLSMLSLKISAVKRLIPIIYMHSNYEPSFQSRFSPFPLMSGRYSRQTWVLRVSTSHETLNTWPHFGGSLSRAAHKKMDFVIVDQFYRQKLVRLWTMCLHKLKNLINNSEALKKGITSWGWFGPSSALAGAWI